MDKNEILGWLDTASPEQMHCVICTWMWGDANFEIPMKIVTREDCDASTALEAFFAFEGPATAEESAKYLREEIDFMLVIANRLKGGFYKTWDFSLGDHHAPQLEHSPYDRPISVVFGPGSYWNLPEWCFKPPANFREIDCFGYCEGDPDGMF